MAVWSTVNFSALTDDRRMDAEFYRPEYLALDRLLTPKRATPWGDLPGRFIVGPFGSDFLVENYLGESPYRYIRGRDVKPFFLLEDQNCFMPQCDFDRLSKHHIQSGDLLVSVVGTIGAVAVVTDDVRHAVFSCKSTAYRPESLDPYYLCAYLNSPTGQAYLIRMTRGHVQTGLNLPDLKRVPILRIDHAIEEAISALARKAYSAQQQAKRLLKQTEAILDSVLGLDRVDLGPQLFYEDRFSQISASGRFDAEHFQPKFKALLEALRNRDFELLPLGEIINPVKNGFDCRDFCDDGTPYIRVGDVKKGRLEIDGCARIPLKAKDLSKDISLEVGDVLFTRKGSFGNAAHVRPGQEHAVISSEIMLIRLKPALLETILPEYLSLYLNSKAGALQAEKWAHGVAFFSISQEDLARFMIPILPIPKQKELKAKTDEAETAYQESRRLLDCAKRAVEIAINKGEEAARKFLDKQ